MALHPWPIKKLGDVVAGITVGHVGPMTTEYRPSGIPFLRSQNVRRLRIDPEGLCHIGEEFHAKLSKSRLKPGDVVVVRTGEPGTAAVVPGWLEDANCADLVIIRPGNSNPRFIAYFINSATNGKIADVVVGAVQQHFNVGAARELLIPTPCRKIQDGIAEVLGALDDKIELNQRMKRTLEELGSASFSSWFVDFDPVMAKRDGRKLIGVPQWAVEHFPNHFEECELGPIPQGWRVTRVDEAFELNPKRELPRGQIAPYLEMAVLPTTGHSPEGWVRRAAGSGMRFSNGDTLMARITPCLENGKTAFVDVLEAGEVGWGSTEYIVIRSRLAMPLVPSYLLARSDDFRAFAIQGMTGSSGRQRVGADVLGSYKLPLPSDPRLLEAFGTFVEPFLNMARANSTESRTLVELRDALLGPLLSGELTIKAAEQAVGAVL